MELRRELLHRHGIATLRSSGRRGRGHVRWQGLQHFHGARANSHVRRIGLLLVLTWSTACATPTRVVRLCLLLLRLLLLMLLLRVCLLIWSSSLMRVHRMAVHMTRHLCGLSSSIVRVRMRMMVGVWMWVMAVRMMMGMYVLLMVRVRMGMHRCYPPTYRDVAIVDHRT